MAVKTTCIGAYPKPDYVPISDWFQVGHEDDSYTEKVLRKWDDSDTQEARELLDRATCEVIADQIECGIDVPTDGEIRRDNYVHYQCRHFEGFDFENLTERVLRNGAYTSFLPTIRSDIKAGDTSTLVNDWRFAEEAAGRPVKITMPGPMTVSDTTADAHYNDAVHLATDLAKALNAQVTALADAGCTNIQIDEPIFARKPKEALEYGIDTLRACFDGVPDTVNRAIHMCCGYPNALDAKDYPKADPDAYLQIAEAVDGIADEISIEDAHRHNPNDLFSRFSQSKLIVGFVTIASNRVEPVDEVKARMAQVLEILPKEQMIAAPDCGLGFLGRELAMTKLRVLTEAAQSF